MPGRVFLTTPIDTVARVAGRPAGDVTGEPPRRNIAPGQQVVVVASAGLTRMRWGMIPVGRVNARGRPVMETIVNARSETVFDKSAFSGVGRAAMPVDGWYEWTGEKRRKTAWRITPRTGGLLWFAAITDTWNGPGGVQLDQVATVTCAPSADVRDIHHRMAVILRSEDIDTWLTGDEDAATALMLPWPDGGLEVAPADDVDWSAP